MKIQEVQAKDQGVSLFLIEFLVSVKGKQEEQKAFIGFTRKDKRKDLAKLQIEKTLQKAIQEGFYQTNRDREADVKNFLTERGKEQMEKVLALLQNQK